MRGSGHELSESHSGNVEQVLGQFEDAWLSGARPSIEDYLPLISDAQDEVLVELVFTDLEFRIKARDVVQVEEYLMRFPQLA